MRSTIIPKIIIAFIILYIISYLSGGFVNIIGPIAEQFASTAYTVLVIGIILLIVLPSIAIYRVKKTAHQGGEHGVREAKRAASLIIGAFVIALIFIPIINSVLVIPSSGSYIASHYVEIINKPIEVSMTRIIPLETAYAYALSLLQIPTHTIYMDESYVYYKGDSIVYNWIIEPEGFWNELFRNAYGVVFVNGSSYPPDVEFINHTLYWSLHRVRLTPLYIDTLYRELKARSLSCKPLLEDNIEVKLGNQIFILVPLETWTRGADYYVPMLYGYAVISANGNIRIVRADKIYSDPVLGQVFRIYKIPVVPEIIAREWISLYRWSPGFINVAFYHQTFTIRDIGMNPQPYLVFDNKGHLYWLFVAEPSGVSYAIKYIIYVDAETTQPVIKVYKPPTQWIGASKIASYIQKAHPRYDWSRFKLAEPIPIIINGTLYWKVTIITSDGRGVISIDLVNAKTGNVYSLPVQNALSLQEFKAFLKTLSGAHINITMPSTLQRIEMIKKKITSMIQELQQLLQQLNELEKQINKTRSQG